MTSTQATLPVPARYAGRLIVRMHIVTFALVATAVLTEGKADDYCRLRVWNDAEWKGCAGHMYFPPTECYGPRKANDRISSFVVESGVWILCEHSKKEGRGECIGPYRPGEGEKNLDNKPKGDSDWNDKISSIFLIQCDQSVKIERGLPPLTCQSFYIEKDFKLD
jgi:hypothetical protein